MLTILTIFSLIFIITNILMIVCLIVSKKSLNQREKLSAFECGFDQKSSSRLPFSLRFFLIAIIFLIFDVEIALILPAVVNLPLTSANLWFWLNNLFILILLVGLIHEWIQGALEWSN